MFRVYLGGLLMKKIILALFLRLPLLLRLLSRRMKPTRVCISNFAPALLTSTIPISPSSTHGPSRTIASTRSSTPSPLQPLAVSWAMISAASASASNWPISARSEEHTSELQTLMRISYAVFCLKKKKKDKLSQLQTLQNKHRTHNDTN